ncbi:MAG: response regulator transcription factor [Rhodoferax sp.]
MPVPFMGLSGARRMEGGAGLNKKDVVRVLIVVDDAPYLQRCAAAVLADPRLSLTAGVTGGAAAIALLDSCAPDVMVIDPGLPDMAGSEVILHARRHCPGTLVLVVAESAHAGAVLSGIEAGATGYLLKNVPAARICLSIHELHDDGASVGPGMASHVLASLQHAPDTAAPAAANGMPVQGGESTSLSHREIDILRLVAKGLAFSEVSALLSISQHTVVAHVKNIYRKLQVHSRGEAVFEASQLGLL